MVKDLRPGRVADVVASIASRIGSSGHPSASAVTRDIGRLLLALDTVPVAAVQEGEGQSAVPVGEMMAHLQKWLTAKYAIDIAYRSFADRVRGPWRDSLVDHWHEHSKEERQHAYDLAMRIVGLGGDPAQTSVQVPPCTQNLEGFFKVLAGMELEAITAGRKAIAMSGENTSMKVMAENFVLVDTQHLDDLRRMAVQFQIP